MASSERDRGAPATAPGASTEDGPALRDAGAAAERAARDETAAAAARARYRTEPLPAVVPDPSVSEHLQPGEQVHTLRPSAILSAPGDKTSLGYGGTLYLTSRRLIHLGQVSMTVPLTDIIETALAGERLLLTLRNGEGIRLDVDQPRLFRAELAAATRQVRR